MTKKNKKKKNKNKIIDEEIDLEYEEIQKIIEEKNKITKEKNKEEEKEEDDISFEEACEILGEHLQIIPNIFYKINPVINNILTITTIIIGFMIITLYILDTSVILTTHVKYSKEDNSIIHTIQEATQTDPSKYLTKITPDIDEEWIKVLKNNQITSIEPFTEHGYHGLATKWIVTFTGGYVAMIKEVGYYSYLQYKDWITWTWKDDGLIYSEYDPSKVISYHVVRLAHRREQGANEIICYYLDRLLGLYRKPPIVGRFISSKILYKNSNDLQGMLRYYLPEQLVPISIHAWVDGLETDLHLPYKIHEYLTFHYKNKTYNSRAYPAVPNYRNISGNDYKKSGDISDTLVFDALVDEHDRKLINWVKDQHGDYLIWDNGLAFSHGPEGTRGCVNDLLCGPDEWEEDSTEWTNVFETKYPHEGDPREYQLNKNINVLKNGTFGCLKICRFRKKLYLDLLDYSTNNKYDPSNSLGSQLNESLKNDYLFPIFNYNLYYVYGRYPKVHFQSDDFLTGLNNKLDKIINHIEDCITIFGYDNVISDEI